MNLIPLQFETLFGTIRSNNAFTLVDGVAVWGNWHDEEFVLMNKAKVKDSSGGVHKLKYKDGLWSVTYPIVGETYTPCYPYYEQGSIREVVKTVKEDKSVYTKFPLFLLVTIDESYEKISDQFYKYPLKGYICAESDEDYTPSEREENSYQNNLVPLMRIIERYCDRNSYLFEDFNPKFIHKWGLRGLYGVEGNVFDEMVDALEIETELTFNINCN